MDDSWQWAIAIFFRILAFLLFRRMAWIGPNPFRAFPRLVFQRMWHLEMAGLLPSVRVEEPGSLPTGSIGSPALRARPTILTASRMEMDALWLCPLPGIFLPQPTACPGS